MLFQSYAAVRLFVKESEDAEVKRIVSILYFESIIRTKVRSGQLLTDTQTKTLFQIH